MSRSQLDEVSLKMNGLFFHDFWNICFLGHKHMGSNHCRWLIKTDEAVAPAAKEIPFPPLVSEDWRVASGSLCAFQGVAHMFASVRLDCCPCKQMLQQIFVWTYHTGWCTRIFFKYLICFSKSMSAFDQVYVCRRWLTRIGWKQLITTG